MERQEFSENVEALYNSIKLSLDLLKDRLAKYDEELTNTILSYCHVNRDHVTKQASTEQNSTSNTVEEETEGNHRVLMTRIRKSLPVRKSFLSWRVSEIHLSHAESHRMRVK